MAVQLCPRCNLNYVKPVMTYCKICTKELKKEADDEVAIEICLVCGVNTIEHDQDICKACLKARVNMSGYVIEDENVSEDVESSSDELDGMRLVDLENDAPDDIKEDFE